MLLCLMGGGGGVTPSSHGGGYPIPGLDRGGGAIPPPSRPGQRGGTLGTSPPSRPGHGVPWVSPTIQTWSGGYPPPSKPGQGVPQGTPTIQTWPGGYPWYPPPKPGMGYFPTQTWDGYPLIQTSDGVPPPWPDLGWGYPPDLGQGTPRPPPMVNRQTFPSINITFSRTTYAGGSKF